MQAPPPEQVALNEATGMLVGPVKVVLAELANMTWNFQRLSEFKPKFMKKFGEPAGGAVMPSSPTPAGRRSWSELEALLGGRWTSQHLGTIKCTGLLPQKSAHC